MNKKLSFYKRNLVILKIGFMQKLVYKFNMIIGIIASFLVIIILKHLWSSLYSNSTDISVSLPQTLTYSAISVIIAGIYPDSLIRTVEEKIKYGDIIFDITRPMNLMSLLFSESLGQVFANILTGSLPLILLVVFTFNLVIPTSLLIWGCFLLSFIFGIIIIFLIDFIFSMSGFWTTGMTGIFFAKRSLISILSGSLIPLWIYPELISKVLLFSPFPAITYIPLSILIGHIPANEIFTYLTMQIFWIFTMWLSGILLYNKAIKKLTVLGG